MRPPDPPPVGGMAVLDGVMMRGQHRWAVAIRRSDGTIATLDGPVPDWAARVDHVPVVRGVVALAASLSLGVRALLWSADQAPDRAGEPPMPVGRTIATALFFATGLFFVLPAAAVHAFADGGRVAVAVEAVVRLGVFIAYLALVGLLPDVRRVFQYHGAEHMAVGAHEAGSLDVASALTRSTRHDRCGTTFLLVVVMLTAVAGFAIGDVDFGVLLASRVVALPVIAGLAYEVIRRASVAGSHRVLTAVVLAPGRALQALTTRAADESQVEVAVEALRLAVMPAEDLAVRNA